MDASAFDYGEGCRCIFEIGTTQKKEFDEELVAFGSHSTVRIRFPSLYIKYAPIMVEVIEQEDDALVERRILASYEKSFRRELEHFHRCVIEGTEPETPGREGLEDVRLTIEIVRAALSWVRSY